MELGQPLAMTEKCSALIWALHWMIESFWENQAGVTSKNWILMGFENSNLA